MNNARMDKLLSNLRACLQPELRDNDTLEFSGYIKNGGLATVTITKRLTPAGVQHEAVSDTRS